jgi:hypothetical protein
MKTRRREGGEKGWLPRPRSPTWAAAALVVEEGEEEGEEEERGCRGGRKG